METTTSGGVSNTFWGHNTFWGQVECSLIAGTPKENLPISDLSPNSALDLPPPLECRKGNMFWGQVECLLIAGTALRKPPDI
jgi:hypothetical protein